MKLHSSNSYVARQAIVSANQEIVGYELLVQDSGRDVIPQDAIDEATSRLFVESQIELGFENLVGIHKAFINFSERSLLENFPLAFDKSKIIVEIMGSVKPTARVMRACSLLRTKGYKLSLDDGLLRSQWSEHGELIEIVKVEIGSMGTRQLKTQLSHLKNKRKTILAKGVDTHEQFAHGKEMGIDYFQGDFLSKPELVEKQQFSSSKVNMLELMAETSKKRLDFETIRTIIFRDVLLSFKLLKFMDSPAFGLSNAGKIKSLGHALTYLGETEFRKFIALVAMASIGEDKPPALVSLAAVRARFCEFLAHELGNKADADSAFLCGLMSLIDAVMNEPIETIFLKLPIDRAIKDAIKGDESEIGTILKLAVAYENGEWRQVEEHARQLSIEELTLGSNYRNAIYWARSFENAFSDSGAPQK